MMPSGKAGLIDANQDRHEADQPTINPFAFVGHRGADRVGRHEDQPEGQTAHDQVPVEAERQSSDWFPGW